MPGGKGSGGGEALDAPAAARLPPMEKTLIACGSPSSKSSKSSLVSPATGWPFLSWTITSTVTNRVAVLMVVAGIAAGGVNCGAAGGWGVCAEAGWNPIVKSPASIRHFRAFQTPFIFIFTSTSLHVRQPGVRYGC